MKKKTTNFSLKITWYFLIKRRKKFDYVPADGTGEQQQQIGSDEEIIEEQSGDEDDDDEADENVKAARSKLRKTTKKSQISYKGYFV